MSVKELHYFTFAPYHCHIYVLSIETHCCASVSFGQLIWWFHCQRWVQCNIHQHHWVAVYSIKLTKAVVKVTNMYELKTQQSWTLQIINVFTNEYVWLHMKQIVCACVCVRFERTNLSFRPSEWGYLGRSSLLQSPGWDFRLGFRQFGICFRFG